MNTEHLLQTKELKALNDDLYNCFNRTDVGQVFVDKELLIRKFNTAAIQLLNLVETDKGRPVECIAANLNTKNLLAEITKVTGTGITVEKEVVLVNKSTCLVRIQPYICSNNQTDGVVISVHHTPGSKGRNSIIETVFNNSHSAILYLKSIREENGNICDFECMAANHAADALVGMGSTGYMLQSARENCPQLLHHGLLKQLVTVVVTGKSMQKEIVFEKGGRQKWFEVLASKMEDGLVITITDIDEKKALEDKSKKNLYELIVAKESLHHLNSNLEEKIKERTFELTESEERFRLIARATSDVVWDWNIVNNHIWWSDSFYNLFGFNVQGIEVGQITFWLQQIHTDDRQRVQHSIQNAINQAAQNWVAHYRFKKQDGSHAFIVHKGSVVINESGVPYRMVGSMADVTGAERAEAKLHQKHEELKALYNEFKFVTDFIPQIVWITRPDGYHEFYNKQWFDYTGTDYEQAKDRGWNTVLHPDDKARAWKVWTYSLETGEPYEIEYRFKKFDGTYRWFLGRALPLKDDSGNIIKWFGTCTDVHDQKTASDTLEMKVEERTSELSKVNRDLELSNGELKQFAFVASHDLKEPLRKIQMFSTIIKEQYGPESPEGLTKYLDRIQKSSARMTNLIEDLLTFSKLSIADLFVTTDLNVIVQEVLNDLELAIGETGAVIEINKLAIIEVIPAQMRQVFQNLISNSLKFIKPDAMPHINISGARVNSLSAINAFDANGSFYQVTIRDNGIGFDVKYTEKIFTIFQRLHSREQYEGTGIGLSITKKVIDKHNGFITAESREGAGTSFIFILPLKQ